MKFKVACLQLNSKDDVDKNVEKIDSLMKEATLHGVKFVTLPENALRMGFPSGDDSNNEINQATHDAIIACRQMARNNKVWMLIGSVAFKSGFEAKRFNRSLLIDPQGEIKCHYDKINLFDVELPNGESYRESDRFISGNELKVTDSPWGKIGLSICYDLRFPEMFRQMNQMGAKIFTVPAAFTYTTGKAHWHTLLKARAIENAAYVIAPAQCGIHAGGRRTYGHSLVISPWGEIIAEGSENEEEVVITEIDMHEVEKVKATIPSTNC